MRFTAKRLQICILYLIFEVSIYNLNFHNKKQNIYFWIWMMDLFNMGGRRFSRKGKSMYAELDLNKDASEVEIKRQYKKLALKYHPDKNPGSPEALDKFKSINKAHRTLTDPKRREIYDKYGSFGIHLADQFGEDDAESYAILSSWWFQSLLVCGSIFTLCCCCCCFCCCCNCCCGKCGPKEDESIPSEHEMDDQSISSYDGLPTLEQPRSNSSPVYTIPLPENAS